MKKTRKRILMSFLTCFVACVMMVMPVMAATTSSSYFSKTTVKLNAINGGKSTTSTLSSGSVSDGASITSVKVFVKVASGTDPYTLYIKSPDGTTASFSGPTSSKTFTTTTFNGEDPEGSWSVWIVNSGVSYNGNIYPTSTATVTLTGYYSY